MSATRTAYIIDGYGKFAGAYMTYQIGRILKHRFGFLPVIAHYRDHPPPARWEYPDPFPYIQVAEMERRITENDLIVTNAASPRELYGLRHPGKKLMYVQAFTTFEALDCFYDAYACTSTHVQNYLNELYGVKPRIIPPFIHLEKIVKPIPWTARPPRKVLMMGKAYYFRELVDLFYATFNERHPNVEFIPVEVEECSHEEILALMGEYRYFLWLTACEGFGLPPAEAMANGCTVVAFHGFGGLDYLENGRNCEISAYPKIGMLADGLARVLADDDYAQALAARGHYTAQRYGMGSFEEAWTSYIEELLGIWAS